MASCSRPSAPARTAARSFSKTRGTPKNQTGRTSGNEATTCRGSGQHVALKPNTIGK